MINFLLLIIAFLASLVLFPFGWAYSFVTYRLKINRLSIYARQIAISIDQMANVVLQNYLNDWLITKQGYKFGNPDETLSSCLGKNKRINELKMQGKFWAKFLNDAEKDHVEKSIEEDENDKNINSEN